MVLETAMRHRFEELIGTVTGKTESIVDLKPITGGDISRAFRMEGKSGVYFVKMNKAGLYPGMYRMEADGLMALGPETPAVLGFGTAGNDDFLIMEWVEPAKKTSFGQENLGRLLAEIHQKTAPQFGLNGDNYIGNIRQQNAYQDSWSAFFIQNRLQYLLKSAVGRGLIDLETERDFDRIYARIPMLFDEEPPALLHGDLWSGNYLITAPAKPMLIDPAIYYGHREADIAMTLLFGGFQPDFYAAYHEQFPLAAGWQERVSLWNLYPLLVHVNIFGTTYLPQLLSHMKKWL